MNSGIPPLAGLCTYKEGGNTGYSVEHTVTLLRRYLYIEGQTSKCLAAHLNGVPEWEVKCAFSLHLWQDAEHCLWLRNRVAEMRTPPLQLDRVPDRALEAFFEELIRSSKTLELLQGFYSILKPASIEAMKEHIEEANPLIDHPTLRLLKFILIEEEEQVEWGSRALDILSKNTAPGEERSLGAWEDHLGSYLLAAGGISAEGERLAKEKLPPARATKPFDPVRTPGRDDRFTKLWNSRGRPPKPEVSAEEQNWWHLYVRLTEMHVPELIALILYDWKDQPWEFYRDLARQLWDEARHSMMGEIAFEVRGENWAEVPHEISFAEFPNKHLDPRDRYALLWGIEKDLMKNTGKRRQYEVAKEAGDSLSTTFHDFDWADEVLHVHIARKWLKWAFDSGEEMEKAFERANELYRSIMNKDQELPRSDWWDDFYKQLKERQARGKVSS